MQALQSNPTTGLSEKQAQEKRSQYDENKLKEKKSNLERFAAQFKEVIILILIAAHRNGMPKDTLNNLCPRFAEILFDSDRKLMSTVNKIEGKYIVIVKGAFDVIAPRCIAGDLEQAARMNEQMSQNALRVLAMGYKEIDSVPEDPTLEEGNAVKPSVSLQAVQSNFVITLLLLFAIFQLFVFRMTVKRHPPLGMFST